MRPKRTKIGKVGTRIAKETAIETGTRRGKGRKNEGSGSAKKGTRNTRDVGKERAGDEEMRIIIAMRRSSGVLGRALEIQRHLKGCEDRGLAPVTGTRRRLKKTRKTMIMKEEDWRE